MLDPDALAALVNSLPREDKPPNTVAEIAYWLRTNGKKFRGNWNEDVASPDWLRTVHAPSLLNCLLNDIAGAGDNYEKTSHSKFLTEWLIEHRPEALNELAQHILGLVESNHPL